MIPDRPTCADGSCARDSRTLWVALGVVAAMLAGLGLAMSSVIAAALP